MLCTPQILLQAAVVLVEVVFFILDLLGITVAVGRVIKKGIAKTILESIKSCPQTLTAIEGFVSSWKVSNGKPSQAWAICGLLKGMSRDILWIIVKAAIKGMSKRDWFKAIAIFSAKIIGSFLTDGLALAVDIGLHLQSAFDLIREIGILVTLVQG